MYDLFTHVYQLDDINGTTLWADTITKEMKDTQVYFDILPTSERTPQGFQFAKCRMIFDIKMEDISRKARLVTGGHIAEAPKCMTYSNVVFHVTVYLVLTLAALNGLEVKAHNIMNTHVTTPVTEKIWTILGPEFGADTEKNALVVYALYGLKSAGAGF